MARKLLSSVFLVLLLVYTGAVHVSAAELTVSPENDVFRLVLEDQGDLFKLSEAVPGATADHSITAVNKYSKTVALYMQMVPGEDGSGWETNVLKQIFMEIHLVGQGNESRILYEGSYEQLAVDTFLCNLDPNETALITFYSYIPITAGNDIQKYSGQSKWILTASADDNSDNSSSNSSNGSSTRDSNTNGTTGTDKDSVTVTIDDGETPLEGKEIDEVPVTNLPDTGVNQFWFTLAILCLLISGVIIGLIIIAKRKGYAPITK